VHYLTSLRSKLLVLLPAIGIAVAGCSGSGEDPRETFCKNLTVAMYSLSDDVQWQESEQVIKDPQFAKITVRPKTGNRATCWFEYDAPEETAESHVDPLSAYATLPYRMTLNGKAVAERTLLDAVNAEQIRQGKAVVEQLRQAAYR
jgi:hypothetical protein